MPKRKMPPPYAAADLIQKELNRKILKRLSDTKRNLTILGFDELNVMQEVSALYAALYRDTERLYRLLYEERYLELLKWLDSEEPDEDELDDLVEMWLAGFLKTPNEILHYAFDTEILRKRDRAIEAINSVPTKIQKQVFLEKHGRYYLQMATWYTDMASHDAELQALRDAGIKKVKWNIYGDDHVCKPCYDRNGKIYDIDKVPSRIHPRCRCYLTPV